MPRTPAPRHSDRSAPGQPRHPRGGSTVTRQAQFGVRIPVAGVLSSPQAIRSSAIEADRAGFDTLWVHDYLIWNKTLDSVHISCGSREAFEAAGPDYPPMFYESITSL